MVRIRNLSAVLKEYNPDSLNSFLRKYPEKNDVLAGMEILGEKEPVNVKSFEAEMELALVAIGEVRKRIHPNFDRMKKRYTKSKFLKTAAAMIAAFSSAGLLTAIAGKAANAVVIATAILNFISSAFLLFANNLETPSIDGRRNIGEVFEKLNSVYSDAEKAEFQLRKKLNGGITFGVDVLNLIEKAEDLAFQLRNLERQILK